VEDFPLASFVLAVVARYGDDPSKPSVVLSAMTDGQYYVSIVRYMGKYGTDKHVVCNARDPDLFFAMRKLAAVWRDQHASMARFLAPVMVGDLPDDDFGDWNFDPRKTDFSS
jgi:hypothetical protein